VLDQKQSILTDSKRKCDRKPRELKAIKSLPATSRSENSPTLVGVSSSSLNDFLKCIFCIFGYVIFFWKRHPLLDLSHELICQNDPLEFQSKDRDRSLSVSAIQNHAWATSFRSVNQVWISKHKSYCRKLRQKQPH
jgi:hypothetical protein